MIPVSQALDALFELVAPLPSEEIPLRAAAGRVLAAPVRAWRAQPPFSASAMDGYAVADPDPIPGTQFNIIGESAAGHGFSGSIGGNQAVRIFTGAPIPQGTARVIIQEDMSREGDGVTLVQDLSQNINIRPQGSDFPSDFTFPAPCLLGPSEIALLASMNAARVQVTRAPEVALISTGDELVNPGDSPGPDQIIASNTYGLDAMLRAMGTRVRLLPIARDSRDSLRATFDLARGADLVITIGGASVGDHDLVGAVATELGMKQSFYKVAMRPGKPLMAGRMGTAAMIGLPGNPVSAMVCGHVFVAPVIRALQGLPAAPAPRRRAPLGTAMPANGSREHYLRASLTAGGILPESRQDSALLSVLARSDALILRPPDAPAAPEGTVVEYIPI
ncbi:molybdopterin molybdotransferase MoeA [Pseudooceanicola aestuarii]|uniref:molybdopterin molybdotransferase MoeA n=1 Tax=Pseudooceanicola aestuarii TaxID=2697319 RepID=UPI0013D13E82|nr:molybdopterin molybdotransferase MoeA [Pseudooceanicola aestuarii]